MVFVAFTLAATAAGLVSAQSTRTSSAAPATSTIPLVAKNFTYPDLPYRVDTDDGPRGTQQGYNLCNATTEGPTSMCQTSFINSLDDFCLWGPPEPNSEVGSTEGEMVAWCTKPGRGTRVIPAGALKGVQFVKAPSYVQVVGYIDQSLINIASEDYGGEMDPHGADKRGNPLGGLLFSNAFGNSTNGTVVSQTITQAKEWHNFMGSNLFCLKACDPADARDYAYCQHIYDRIGCAYNAPADYANINGTFQSCLSDNQLPPGVYVDDGTTRTYTQPPESLGAISTLPYTAAIPSSSQCTTFESASLYSADAAVSTSAANTTDSAAVTTAAVATAVPTPAVATSATQAVAAAAAVPTSSKTSGASMTRVASGLAGVVAVAAFAVLL